MYTIDDEQRNLPEEEYYENNNWDNYKGIVFKVIIIILCIIVLIWLFKALNSNKNSINFDEIHASNTEKLRLAAEKYFFIENNKGKVRYVTLAGLKSEGLIDNIVDANNETCDEHNTNVELQTDIDAYVMNIDFSCSTRDQDEKFYYHRNNLSCLNCKNAKTNMKGNNVVAINDSKPISNKTEYFCNEWSNWSKERVNDDTLTERKRVLVQGVKYEDGTKYGNWSEYSETPVLKSNNIEVETKTEKVRTWSEIKTGTDIDTTNPNIKVISTNVVDEAKTECTNGYIYNNVCYSNEVTVGNLTFSEYTSGNYNIKTISCDGAKPSTNKDGKYDLLYTNCRYNVKLADIKNTNPYTVYTYQEALDRDVTYYRYRVVVKGDRKTTYTDKKYEENNLPSGYVKVNGSEEIYYSYKLNTCEK